MYEHTFSQYKFVQQPNDEVAVQLLTAPYTGLQVWLGGNVSWREVNEEGEQATSFEYKILSFPTGFDVSVLNRPEFVNHLGEILLGLLEHHYKNGGRPDASGAIQIDPASIQPITTPELNPIGIEHNHVTGATTIVYS